MSVQRGIAFRFLRQNHCRCICKSVWSHVCMYVNVCAGLVWRQRLYTYEHSVYICEPVYLPPRSCCCRCCDFLQSLSLLWLCVLLLLFLNFFFFNIVACRLSFCLRFGQHSDLLLLFCFLCSKYLTLLLVLLACPQADCEKYFCYLTFRWAVRTHTNVPHSLFPSSV